ncbi:type II toxin-antitoxin system RelE/ParE family toxin [Chthonobacter rhizosphaerae]|uniref:type II toxin-antitoxin system RelE/ParE family toxin n=1 Tax=Chthonobacter rhizosphaerae TaxID=2735553 RepID=UPI001FE2703D|nr:type II toxin-antitoxin system RelE/ParE family toxin [Chthonobacter rhizosphaerae]
MEVRFAHSAEYDLEKIADWIGRDDPRRAVTFLVTLREECRAIGDSPLAYGRLDVAGKQNFRRKVFRNYIIVFRIEADVVLVHHILHARQDLTRLLDDLQSP